MASSAAAVLSGGFILVLLLVTIALWLLGDRINPFQISDAIMLPPSGEHWLGTDDLGRSMLLQVAAGIRISLTVGFASALAATLLGIAIGSIAGYAGGRTDAVVMRVAEFFQVMPTFILAALIVALAGPGELRIIAVIAALSWPQTARLIRGEVMRLKHLGFVEAARCLGIPEWRILLTEVIPNALPPVIALSTLTVAHAILLEASLSFFGLTSPDAISWGQTLNSGQRFLYQAWWMSVFPGVAIFLTVLAFNLLGDAVSRALSPRRRSA